MEFFEVSLHCASKLDMDSSNGENLEDGARITLKCSSHTNLAVNLYYLIYCTLKQLVVVFVLLTDTMFGLGSPSLVPNDVCLYTCTHGCWSITPAYQEDFLRGKIKVGGKVGVNVGKPGEGKEVTLARIKNEIEVVTDVPFSKRWALYLN